MENKNYNEEILTMLAKRLQKNIKDVTPEMRIKEDLNADSLDIVELVMDIETKYGVTVPDEVAMEIKTVADLIKTIEKMAK